MISSMYCHPLQFTSYKTWVKYKIHGLYAGNKYHMCIICQMLISHPQTRFGGLTYPISNTHKSQFMLMLTCCCCCGCGFIPKQCTELRYIMWFKSDKDLVPTAIVVMSKTLCYKQTICQQIKARER